MTIPEKALIHGLGDGEENNGFGFKRWFRIRPEDTGGAFAVFEEEIPEDAGPPLHIHKTEFEQFTVLSGSIRFHCNGEEAIAHPGTTVLIPPGARHAFKGIGPGLSRVIIMLSPGRGEGFFRDVEAGKLHSTGDIEKVEKLLAL